MSRTTAGIRATMTATVLMLATTAAQAVEPGPVVSWLVKEPPTLFDVGMGRAEALVQSSLMKIRENHQELETAAAGFDWERNRLLLVYSAPLATFDPMWCEQLTLEVQRLLGVQEHGTPSRIASGFGHIGFRTPNTPTNYKTRLDEIIEVQVHMRGGACQAPLTTEQLASTQFQYWTAGEALN